MTTLSNLAQPQLIEAPAADLNRRYETLAYLEAYDAVLNNDYAFVAYQETDRASGRSIVKIGSRNTAGASLDPVAIRQRCRMAAARNESFFTWGYAFAPTAGDPRQIEFRVHVENGVPKEIEIFVCLRKADHSAAQPQSVRFSWPQI
jgi:hypothetical protein